MSQIDVLTLDQIRLFVGVADEGSFSALARKLHRAQSAVSYGIGNLERNLDVQLFDRSGRRPTLTPTGESLLVDARKVLSAVHQFGARASAVANGLEIEVRVAVSALCPVDLLISIGRAFHQQYPLVALRIQTDIMEAVPALVLAGECQLGISGPFAEDDPRLSRRYLTQIPMVAVAAADHPLAQSGSPLTPSELSEEVQIVIAQRSDADSLTQSVFSNTTWRVADTATKLELIRASLGWGHLPLGLVEADLDRGVLKRLTLEGRGPLSVPLAVISWAEQPPGPAARWFLNQMVAICEANT